MSCKEETVHDLSDSPHVGGSKMSSSLRQRLKRSSRAFSSPLLKPSVNMPLNIKGCTSTPNAENFSDMKPFLVGDIDACVDQKQLEQMHCHLKSQILANEEKLRKLQLVESYNVKNKPDDLACVIQKWLTTSQEASRQLFEKLPENKANFSCMLNTLNIGYDIVKYDPDSDTFY